MGRVGLATFRLKFLFEFFRRQPKRVRGGNSFSTHPFFFPPRPSTIKSRTPKAKFSLHFLFLRATIFILKGKENFA
jgi:hypothetical protein